jgi:hypothetical protein
MALNIFQPLELINIKNPQRKKAIKKFSSHMVLPINMLHGFIAIISMLSCAYIRFLVMCNTMKYMARTDSTLKIAPAILALNIDDWSGPTSGAKNSAGTSGIVIVKFDIFIGNMAGAVPGGNENVQKSDFAAKILFSSS